MQLVVLIDLDCCSFISGAALPQTKTCQKTINMTAMLLEQNGTMITTELSPCYTGHHWSNSQSHWDQDDLQFRKYGTVVSILRSQVVAMLWSGFFGLNSSAAVR